MRQFSVMAVLAGVLGLGLLWVGSLGADEGAGPYKEAPVANGGTISGKITFKGTPPAPKTFDFAKFPQPEFCAKADSDGKGHRLLHEVTVNNGVMADVVVFIEGVPAGKPFKLAGTDVKADTCRFLVQQGSDFVGVVLNKGEIRVTNMDADPSDPKSATGVLHNPHGYEVKGATSSTMFNKPLPNKGQTLTETVKLRKKESFMKMECDQHNFMNAYFIPVENPYYAVVGKDGTFTIDQVPPGTYEIKVWHPILGEEEQKVTVAANGKVTANFEYTK
ncbi:MAG: carboxypeptidase regulatory-like domain-containing protein [Nitrospirae bacterium]|nr:carboxypeptidase regulatory-like domain-containing protein [Nitrospirota bacterium]